MKIQKAIGKYLLFLLLCGIAMSTKIVILGFENLPENPVPDTAHLDASENTVSRILRRSGGRSSSSRSSSRSSGRSSSSGSSSRSSSRISSRNYKSTSYGRSTSSSHSSIRGRRTTASTSGYRTVSGTTLVSRSPFTSKPYIANPAKYRAASYTVVGSPEYQAAASSPTKTCMENCFDCNPSTTCLLCNLGYYLVDLNDGTKGCAKCADANCALCASPGTVCDDCYPEYFEKTGTCSECGDNCETCTDENTCTDCIDGYSVTSDNKCKVDFLATLLSIIGVSSFCYCLFLGLVCKKKNNCFDALVTGCCCCIVCFTCCCDLFRNCCKRESTTSTTTTPVSESPASSTVAKINPIYANKQSLKAPETKPMAKNNSMNHTDVLDKQFGVDSETTSLTSANRGDLWVPSVPPPPPGNAPVAGYNPPAPLPMPQPMIVPAPVMMPPPTTTVIVVTNPLPPGFI